MMWKAIGDTSEGRGITVLWGPMAYGIEFVLWNHAWFVGYDKGWPK